MLLSINLYHIEGINSIGNAENRTGAAGCKARMLSIVLCGPPICLDVYGAPSEQFNWNFAVTFKLCCYLCCSAVNKSSPLYLKLVYNLFSWIEISQLGVKPRCSGPRPRRHLGPLGLLFEEVPEVRWGESGNRLKIDTKVKVLKLEKYLRFLQHLLK